MEIVKELDEFIRKSGNDIFIEAEGRPSRLARFYEEYYSYTGDWINANTDGIIELDENANKWGLELRLYLHNCPSFIPVTNNRVYRKEYAYRINDVPTIKGLFKLGYKIGLNY